jgi:hypothetical protein
VASPGVRSGSHFSPAFACGPLHCRVFEPNRLRPRRARCRVCHVTFMLLPAWCAPHRADVIEVIATAAIAAIAAAGGYGPRAIGSWLGVPDSTVRGWLRRLCARAGQLRSYAIGELSGFDSTTPLPCEPTGSPRGDALDTVAAVTRAAQRKPGYSPELTWALMGRLGLARYLQPARAG